MDIFLRILTIFGSLGLFLFGMKLLSEALQKVAGKGIRRTMEVMTLSQMRRIMSGTLITTIIQSSSAVTVMIVGFVNAGIVSLRQAIGLIFGANIGTTITAWLICLFGFKFSIGSIAVPLAGLGFALILMQRNNYRAIGSMIMGFALLFIGLDILQVTFEDIIKSTLLAELLRDYSTQGYASILLMIVVGALLTAIIQSSSATITLTLVLCQNGWMPIEAGAAMILGENIGTTITANIAAIVANNTAKRAAISHTIINIIGILWAVPFLPLIMIWLDWITVPFSLAMFHTLFNVTNTLLCVNFVPQIIKLTNKIFPTPKSESRQHLKVLNTGLLSTAEISVTQSSNEIINQSRRSLKMFQFVRATLSQTDDQEFEKLYQHIEKYEQITDRVEQEIITYLTELSRSDLSHQIVLRVQNMFRIISHIKNIAEMNLSIAKIVKIKREKNLWFDPTLRTQVQQMFSLIEQFYYLVITNLSDPNDIHLAKAEQMERQINELYAELRDQQLSQNDSEREYKYVAGVIFIEIIRECEKMGDSLHAIIRINNNCKVNR